VVGTNLQINDNMENVEEENIEITGVDPGETEDYQTNDLEINQQPSQPTTELNDEVPTYEPTNMGTTKTVIKTPTTTPIVQSEKEPPQGSVRNRMKATYLVTSMKGK